jgi:Ni,Fe-hydrogenase I cytochrome b subunit
MIGSDRKGIQDQIYVWDAFVRSFHWMLVLSVTAAFLTEKGTSLHAGAGYTLFGGSSAHGTPAFPSFSTRLPVRFGMYLTCSFYGLASATSGTVLAASTL